MPRLRLVHSIPGRHFRLHDPLPAGLINSPQLSVSPEYIGTNVRYPIGRDALDIAGLLIDCGMEYRSWVGVAWNRLVKEPQSATRFHLGFGVGLLENLGAVSVISAVQSNSGRTAYIVPREGLVDLFN